MRDTLTSFQDELTAWCWVQARCSRVRGDKGHATKPGVSRVASGRVPAASERLGAVGEAQIHTDKSVSWNRAISSVQRKQTAQCLPSRGMDLRHKQTSSLKNQNDKALGFLQGNV